MAYTYTFAEAVQAFATNNKDQIADIGKRMPMLANELARAVSGDVDAFVRIASVFPERITAGPVNKLLMEGVDDVGDVADVAPAKAKPAAAAKPAADKPAPAKAAPAKAAAPAAKGKLSEAEKKEMVKNKEKLANKDYGNIGAFGLYVACKARDLEVKSKQPKEEYIKLLKKADKAGGDTAAAPAKGGKPAAAAPAKKNEVYELYKQCVDAGLDVEQKKSAKYYKDALAAAQDSGNDESWDEDGAAGGDDESWDL